MKERAFEAYEDCGGNITIVTIEDGEAVSADDGHEARLADPQEVLDELRDANGTGVCLIADSKRMYPMQMGSVARKEFDVADDDFRESAPLPETWTSCM